MKKHIISALCALLLLSVLIIPANAAVPDANRTGSISAAMTHDGRAVPGGTLTIYRVAELDLTGDYGYRLVEPYTDSGIALDDIGSASTASALAEYTRRNRIEGTTKEIDRNGEITFDGLQTGLYLVMQYDAPRGYFALDPFLVSIPALDGAVYIYDVNATPKLELETAPPPPPPETTEPATEPEEPTEPQLPQTGQMNWPVPVLAAGGLSLMILGWYLYTTGRKKTNET